MANASKIGAIFFAAILLVIPSTTSAWNIICGISISKKSMDRDMGQIKWDADSRALRGISLFYAAVSELQRIELKKDGKIRIPNSLWRPDVSAIEQAVFLLRSSAIELNLSLKLANEYKLGDDKGLKLLNDIHGSVNRIYNELNENNAPTLDTMHSIARNVKDFVEHGIELSKMHLERGLPGHGRGGIKLR